MKTVGVRDLKNRLSEYIRQVRAGEGVLVTDRGEVVAEITTPGQGASDPDVPAGLRDLARRGHATLATASGSGEYPSIPPASRKARPSAALLDDERGSR